MRTLRALETAQGEPVDRKQLHRELGGHVPAEDLTEALSALEHAGLARRKRVDPGPRGGRPTERWSAVLPGERTANTEETGHQDQQA